MNEQLLSDAVRLAERVGYVLVDRVLRFTRAPHTDAEEE